MGYVVSLLSRLDAAVQRRFDSVCFFLMSRFGVRKSTLRYLFIAIVAVGFAAIIVDLIRHNHVWLSLLSSLLLISVLIGQYLVWLVDRAAETGDARAIAAVERAGHPSRRNSLQKVISLAFLALASLVSSDAYELTLAGAKTVMIGRLLIAYIAKTPMNPPAEKAREHVGMPQTAPAQT